METMNKTLRHVLVALLLIAGAAFFYIAGLGTGLMIARPAKVALLPAENTSTPAPALTWTPAPELTPTGTPTLESIPAKTPTPAPTPTQPAAIEPSPDQEESFDIFWEAWEVLQEQFYGELPSESELPYAAIRGVIGDTDDQYTAFLDPVQSEIVSSNLSGSFEGIGATVRMRPDGLLEIVQPLADQPAIEAGLRAGDVILTVDGTELEGMNLYEAIALIRGPAGTVVNLLVQRPEVEEPFEIQVTRARIETPAVESEMLENGIAYLRLNDFGQTATDEVRSALRDLLAQEPRGLILDLRGNPGGYLSTAVEISSQFIAAGPILIERFRDGSEQIYEAQSGGLATEIPMVVLVDGGSASASEIVAGAIQDTGRGPLIGTQTLGKGSVQLVNTLSDGSQLRVTTARWFTPEGRAIHGEGLAPDVEVELSEEDLEADRDPQLERAIEYLEGN